MSEVRLIDANAFKKNNERLLHCDFPYLSEDTLEELVDREPTVDAKPIVRCIDCKWHEHSEPGMVWCPIIEGSWIEENFFCAYGAKMEEVTE